MNCELRIPAAGLTEEGFATLKAQMRMLFGMPADVMPRSEFDLRMMLEARSGNVYYPFRKWLLRNGYEVVRAPAFEGGLTRTTLSAVRIWRPPCTRS